MAFRGIGKVFVWSGDVRTSISSSSALLKGPSHESFRVSKGERERT